MSREPDKRRQPSVADHIISMDGFNNDGDTPAKFVVFYMLGKNKKDGKKCINRYLMSSGGNQNHVLLMTYKCDLHQRDVNRAPYETINLDYQGR
jgi:hypothetical protein